MMASHRTVASDDMVTCIGTVSLWLRSEDQVEVTHRTIPLMDVRWGGEIIGGVLLKQQMGSYGGHTKKFN